MKGDEILNSKVGTEQTFKNMHYFGSQGVSYSKIIMKNTVFMFIFNAMCHTASWHPIMSRLCLNGVRCHSLEIVHLHGNIKMDVNVLCFVVSFHKAPTA